MKKSILIFTVIIMTFTSCQQPKTNDSAYQPKPYVQLQHPDWSKNSTIYEVNIRQYTPEGTFKAFESHLPRLKAMGVDIIWLMPIHPIGVKNRKGTLGSYYSVKDYMAVNPEFGTMDDFKSLVKKIHASGMHVIIDWVANHSAWDNKLVTEHPEWYSKNNEGNFQPTPWYDWDDIIDFDYEQPELRKYMTEALKFWVSETDIDGYRCDVAGFIPVDFWDNVRVELEAIKPVFMLAEWEDRDMLKNAFDMTYAWTLWNKLREIAKEGKPVGGLIEYMAHDVSTFPRDGYKMTFTDNHDKNSWEGNQYSNFGPALETCIVFAATVNGMPLVYSGQEAGLDRSLRFFDKDTIIWKNHRNEQLYTQLFDLKHKNQALWNGKHGGQMVRVYNDSQDKIISFYREMNENKVLPIFNFSNETVNVTLNTKFAADTYTELFSKKTYKLQGNDPIELPAWGYIVLYK
jgi:glycosidase